MEKKPITKKWWFWTIIVVVVLYIAKIILFTPKEHIEHYTVLGVFFLFCGVGIFICLKQMKKQNKIKNDKKAAYNYKYTGIMKHTNGLPIPQGVTVELFYCDDRIIFKKDNQEISISKDKITSIEVVTGKEINASGAAVGFMAFGLAGAVLGSSTAYLLISYDSNGEQKGITLDTYMSGMLSTKIVNDFKKTRTNNEVKQIEL